MSSRSNRDPGDSSHLTRRDFMKALGAVAGMGLIEMTGGSLLSGCATPTAAPAKVSVQLSWIKNVEFLGFYAADLKGYYSDEKLTVDLAGGGPGVVAGQLVDSRQKDIGVQLAAIDLIKSNAQGGKLVTFATLFQRSPAGVMYITKHPDGRPGAVIDSPQKAKGKRIGLQPGAMLAWRVICQKAGLNMDKDMQIVPVSFDPAPLIDGTIDGYWCFATNQPGILRAQGYEVGVLDAAQWGYTMYGGFLTCHQDYLKENKDTLVRFTRATIKGWAYANSHIDEMAKYVVDNFGKQLNLQLAQQTDEAKTQADYLVSDLTKSKGLFWLDAQNWKDTVAMLVEQKELDKPLDVNTFVTTSILEEVYKQGKGAVGQ